MTEDSEVWPPAEFAEALRITIEHIDSKFEECEMSMSGDVIEHMAEALEITEEEVLAAYGPKKVFGLDVSANVEAELTHRGAGWGAWRGPEPDEYRCHGWCMITDAKGKVLVDEVVDEDGCHVIFESWLVDDDEFEDD